VIQRCKNTSKPKKKNVRIQKPNLRRRKRSIYGQWLFPGLDTNGRESVLSHPWGPVPKANKCLTHTSLSFFNLFFPLFSLVLIYGMKIVQLYVRRIQYCTQYCTEILKCKNVSPNLLVPLASRIFPLFDNDSSLFR